MKPFIVFVFLFCLCTHAMALESMTEPEMKETTGQLATAAGDLGKLVSPVAAVAGEMGPVVAPVSPLMYIYELVSPHTDIASEMMGARETSQDVTRVMRAAGDMAGFASIF